MPLSLGLSFPFAGNRVAGQIARTAAPDGQGKEADVLLTARGDIARAVAFPRGRPPRQQIGARERESGRKQGLCPRRDPDGRALRPARIAAVSNFRIAIGGTPSRSYGPRVRARVIRADFTNNRNKYQKPV